ncbi:MAG: hypothetical protein HY326_00895, partial [Chloroflexi bacterium]|nr:hypothetical protein [Chloroflexota bacterium]
MIDNAFLQRLAQRRPGQNLDDLLVEQAIELASPPVAEALEAAAIPTTFDAEILGVLLDKQAESADLVQQLIKNHSFISPANGHYTYYAPARHTILQKLVRDDPAKFQKLNGIAAIYFQTKADAATTAGAGGGETYLQNSMYHLLASDDQDEDRGYQMLVKMFDRAEEDYQPGTAFLLVRLAAEQREYLSPDHQLGLLWLEGRLAQLQGHQSAAVLSLSKILDELHPPLVLRAGVELSLARALQETGRWADAISHAQAAWETFKIIGDTENEARALIELAQSYAGLARSVRGSRAVRPPLENPVLNGLYQAGILLERVPILVYLVIRLGARRLLPVIGKVARDQDWIVARLFSNAAVYLRQAEQRLGIQDWGWHLEESAGSPLRPEYEAIGIEARRARANLFRTLGHPVYAAELLGDLLVYPPIVQNAYRLAVIRLELADALLDAGYNDLAVEELRAAIVIFTTVHDTASEARARFLMGQAMLPSYDKRQAYVGDRLTAAAQELRRSLELFSELRDDKSRADVARILDDLAEHPDVPASHLARTMARETAARVTERRFPVRYAHPAIQWFRTVALYGLVLAFLIILFLSVRTGSGTVLGASAVIHSGPSLASPAQFNPQVSVQLPEEQLVPRFFGGFAIPTALAVIAGYLLLYLVFGLRLISVASIQALREAEPHYFALDETQAALSTEAGTAQDTGGAVQSAAGESAVGGRSAGIRYCNAGGVAEQTIPWHLVEEAVCVDREIIQRPIASYAYLSLFGNGQGMEIPGLTADYEGKLRVKILSQLPVKPRQMGFSVLKSWSGLLFALILIAHLLFLLAGSARSAIALARIIPPYSLSDLYVFTYGLLLIPLGWWLVVNPVRSRLTLHPEERWPWLMGLGGLLFELVFLPDLPQLSAVLARPDLYPALIGAGLVAVAAFYIIRAHHWQGHPSNRTAA